MAVVGPHLCGLGGDVLAMVRARRARRPRPCCRSGRAGSGSDAAACAPTAWPSCHSGGTSAACRCPAPSTAGSPCTNATADCPSTTCWRPRSNSPTAGSRRPSCWRWPVLSSTSSRAPASSAPADPSRSANASACRASPRTLRAIAHDGRAGFYGGEFGRGLARRSAAATSPGGLHRTHRDVVRRPCTWKRGATTCGRCRHHPRATSPWPAPGSPRRPGSAPTPTTRAGPTSWSRCWRAVGHDRPEVLFDGADGEALLRRGRLDAAAARVAADRAAPPDVGARQRDGAAPAVARLGDGDTTHLCAMDGDGLGISLTQSNALDFGSHLVEPSTGVFLHNRGVGILARRGSSGRGAPGPAAAAHPLPHAGDGAGRDPDASRRRNGRRRAAADHQPAAGPTAAHAGQDPATAIAAPRLTLDAPAAGPFRLWWGEDLTVLVEADAPPGLAR